MDNNYELYHHGVKGMRWGVRRYQNADGSLTTLGRRKRGISDGKEGSKWSVKRFLKKNNESLDMKKKKSSSSDDEEKKKSEQEQYEEVKQKAIKSGSAKEILKYKGDLTPQEMQYVQNRINWEQNMQSISAKEVSAGKAKVDKVFKTVDDITGYVNTGAKAWNIFANIYNAFSKKDVSLPKIDTDITKGNRALRKAEKKLAKKDAEEAAEKAKKAAANNQSSGGTNSSNSGNDSKPSPSPTEEKSNARKSYRIKRDTPTNDETIKNQSEKGELWFSRFTKSYNNRNKSDTSDSKVYTGKVEGEGTSKATRFKSEQSGPIIDVDYSPVSDLPATTVSSGRNYVSNVLMLEDKHGR